jgi:hypothetical protein
MSSHAHRSSLLSLSLVVSSLFCSAASAGVIDTIPHNFAGDDWLIWKAGPKVEYKGNVARAKVNGVLTNIGTVDFEYNRFKGTKSGKDSAAEYGTGGIYGEFKPALPAGVTFRSAKWSWAWLQAVRSDQVGASGDAWGAKPEEWYMDTVGSTTDPRYPFPARGGLVFEDYPERAINAAHHFDAESVLVAINMDDKKVEFIGSAFWGFRTTAAGDVLATGNGVFGEPNSWGAAAADFAGTLTKKWDNGKGFNDWMVVMDQALVPTPGTMVLLATGAIAVRRRRAA